jgi:hypothetical protein
MPSTIIPGAYERNTLRYRQSGSMSGSGSGAPIAGVDPGSLSPATILERQKEGGGGTGQRPKPLTGPRR